MLRTVASPLLPMKRESLPEGLRASSDTASCCLPAVMVAVGTSLSAEIAFVKWEPLGVGSPGLLPRWDLLSEATCRTELKAASVPEKP